MKLMSDVTFPRPSWVIAIVFSDQQHALVISKAYFKLEANLSLGQVV